MFKNKINSKFNFKKVMNTNLENAKFDQKLRIKLIENIEQYHKNFRIDQIIQTIN